MAYTLSYVWLAEKFRWQLHSQQFIRVYNLYCHIAKFYLSVDPDLSHCLCTILVALCLMPNDIVEDIEAQPGPWDIPARILIGTSFILLLLELPPSSVHT